MEEYTIVRRPADGSFEGVPVMRIEAPAFGSPLVCTAAAQVCYDDEALYVHLWAKEENIRAEVTSKTGMPCEDSCLEFFFSPVEGQTRYFNFEFNPNAASFIGIGLNRYNLVRLLPMKDWFHATPARTEDGWEITYKVSYAFIRMFFPEFRAVSGGTMRGNCYKCGDLTPVEHYITWNPVDGDCDFHRPETFGLFRFA
ncbi:MAG: carbohydrate-binding family 9-like protein [Lachnospiraceae bacterium]|nr:carbohydrate-binding family 9-like protein [Lachnospiraceae bacterium]